MGFSLELRMDALFVSLVTTKVGARWGLKRLSIGRANERGLVETENGRSALEESLRIEDVVGPGVDDELIRQVRAWGVVDLTEIQTKAFEAGVASGESMVVCSPTSTGKTMIGEVAIYKSVVENTRCMYLVSHKALADQKYEQLSETFGEGASRPMASVRLSTGDREEGDVNSQLLVATYEKVLALVISGQLEIERSLIVADELQIMGDPTRGPDIEALCTVLRQRGWGQFVALTATIGNPAELAGWLGCRLVHSDRRDVELMQEIWYEGKVSRLRFGDAEADFSYGDAAASNTIGVVKEVLRRGKAPVLVFTESRREARHLAEQFGARSERTKNGLVVAEQLELFSEPTEESIRLRDGAERGVTFHTADLTPRERRVIEHGFMDSHVRVCFATSTLAAGVNFPFQTVLFPKLTYEWGERAGRRISRGEYRNMSGRAGRLGMHEQGCAILLPKNGVEHSHAREIVLPRNDPLASQLLSLTMRRATLMLVSSGIIHREQQLGEFLKGTFYWHLAKENHPKQLNRVAALAEASIDWHIENGLMEKNAETLTPTPLGKSTSLSGLLPSTAISFVDLLGQHKRSLEDEFSECEVGILHWVCSSDEFMGERPSRFLPWASDGGSGESTPFVAGKKLLASFDRSNERLTACVHALALFKEGVEERKIRFATGISSGQLHRLSIDVSWVIDGLHKITCLIETGTSQNLSNRMSMFSRRVRWGAPAEVLDLLRIADRHGVPGFGRQRAMALMRLGLSDFEAILTLDRAKLGKILHSEQRAASLLAALSDALGIGPDRFAGLHCQIATTLGIESIVDECNRAIGTDYEKAIRSLLEVETEWRVDVIDDGVRQNVPDLMLSLGDVSILIECKTTTKSPPLIKKEAAFAVLQKAVDFPSEIHRVTLGKPAFDEHTKGKVLGATSITLVEHPVFVEGVLRVHTGKVPASGLINWLMQPGLLELERLTDVQSR